jgi:hypothetical protein
MALVEYVLGWRVVRLIGNHEVLTLLNPSNSQLVHDGDFSEFGGEWERAASFSRDGAVYTELVDNYVGIARLSVSSPEMRRMNDLNPATLFVHGGMHLGWILEHFEESMTVDAMNEQIAAWPPRIGKRGEHAQRRKLHCLDERPCASARAENM